LGSTMPSDKYTFPDVQYVLGQLKDIVSAVQDAAEATTLAQVLERIAEEAKHLLGVRYAALGVPDESGGMRYFKTAGMTPEEIALMEHLPHGHGLLGVIMNEQETVRLDHMQEDPRSSGFPKHHPHMSSLLGTPIKAGERLYGMLYLCDRINGESFSEQDEWLVEALAGYAALAIAGVQLREQQHRLTLLEERERIGMELHDGIIQSLYAVGMHLDLMRGSDQVKPDDMMHAIHDLNTIIDDIRRYIMDLKRTASEQRTIREALQELVYRMRIPSRVNIEIDASNNPPRFDPATFEAILQIVNEALSNAVRHAEATNILLTALQQQNTLIITVRDDGKGFDPALTSNNNGLGLHNIQQRARIYGGSVDIDSVPDRGTRLTIRIPTNL
jgi:signal transduction histidine kinase